MDDIGLMVRMSASILGRSPQLILGPIRQDMLPEMAFQTRATYSTLDQLRLSGAVIPTPYIAPPQAVNPPNIIPNVPPDDETMIGATNQVSLIVFSNYHSLSYI